MKKELTNSNIDRQNILNNSLAIQEIQEQIWMKWFHFEWKLWFTKKQVTEFFDVDQRTIERYLEANENELRKNWYEIFTGKRLKEAKSAFKSDIDVGLFEDDFGLNNAKSNLWMFDFRSFLNLWMLLIESEKARELRQIILDITIDTINKKTWWNTKYINTRDEQFLWSFIKWEDYRKKFTNALKNYVNMWTIKYPLFTDKVYVIAFKENAKEYKEIIWLSNKESLRNTFYAEILDVVAWIENGIASMIENKSKKLNRLLFQEEVIEIFLEAEKNPFLEPVIEKAKHLMASRDFCFRDVIHQKLTWYIWNVSKEDFEKFIWEKSMDFEKRLEETRDIIKRLKDR